MPRLSQTFAENKRFIAIPIVLLAILSMIILPLPAWMLDILFTFNIVLAIVVLLASVSVKRTLDFSVFPTLLLVATLLRLTLNVASTRVVLLHGNEGGAAAGKVIQAFGEVVIGGNYVVGVVVFMILMIINFVVITKGGERISEVSARFTLDALPGKQMAIDADLNAGLLSPEQAKNRRQEVAKEASFYGAMDGASKFVRGDAIAGLLILVINLVGGICIGIFMFHMAADTAFKTYALLTIGDGLVAQIPSLLLSTAAAIIVTRVSDASDITSQFHRQLLSNPKVIATAAVIMTILGLVPGMPFTAFISFALVLGFTAWRQSILVIDLPDDEIDDKVEQALLEPSAPDWSNLPFIDMLEIRLGYRLIPLVDIEKGNELQKRLTGIRRTLSEQYGFLLAEVRVRDDLTLPANAYRIGLNGYPINQSELQPDKLLAIKGGHVYGEIEGILCRDPAYGMDAVWIEPSNKNKALNLGYSVVDNAAIVATHLAKVIKDNLPDLLQHDDIIAITDRLTQIAPQLADALNSVLTPIQMLKVFRLLLKEHVSIADIKTIATVLLDASENTKDAVLLTADIRCAIGKNIVYSIVGNSTELRLTTLVPELEKILMDAFNLSQQQGRSAIDSFPVEPSLIAKIQEKMPQLLADIQSNGYHPILLVAPQLRPLLARYAQTFAQGLHVLSYNEVPAWYDIQIVGQLG